MYKPMLISLLFLSSAAQATVQINNASDFAKAKGTPELRYYLYGAFAAFGVVNADKELNGGRKLYCQPRGMADASVDLVDLVEKQLPESEKNYQGGIKGLPIEFVVLDALQGHFPCPK